MTDFVGYFRVSTDRQGRSGLGLEAQREAVTRYIAGRGSMLAEFTETESGKRNDRAALADALALCRQKKATLLIARLDRLARSVAFVSNLMESGADFVAVDMPEANRLTIHILAAVAEYDGARLIELLDKDNTAIRRLVGHGVSFEEERGLYGEDRFGCSPRKAQGHACTDLEIQWSKVKARAKVVLETPNALASSPIATNLSILDNIRHNIRQKIKIAVQA